LPENFNLQNLILGYGENVCYIVNDLTNRELIRRKFIFNLPNKKDLVDWDDYFNDEEEDIFQGSTIFN
jgi:hypothetical protein